MQLRRRRWTKAAVAPAQSLGPTGLQQPKYFEINTAAQKGQFVPTAGW